MPSNASDYFSADYVSARRAFLRAAERRRARVISHRLPGHSEQATEELAIDVARLGPEEPECLLVVSSGTHGVEGFSGSALQQRLLADSPALELPPNMALLLVHAVNPWGFAALRRVNEHNVDLNRNFLRHPEDHEPRPDYEALYPHINPEVLDEEHDQRATIALAAFARAQGVARLQQVLSAGQYDHPTGLQYGGCAPEPSNLCLRELAQSEFRGATRIAWIDIHTGLGPSGTAELITEQEPEDPVYVRGRAWYGDSFRSTRAGESVSAPLTGVIESGLAEEVDPASEFTPFTAEFGTVAAERVFWALRADNWLHHHGTPDSERGAAIRSELLEVFRPSNPAWQRAMLDAGFDVVRRARAGLAGSARGILG